MKLTLRYDLGEGPVECRTTLLDIVAWERKYKRKVSTIDSQGIGAEDLAFLAWTASKTAGMTMPAVFDDFLKRIVDLEVVEDGAAGPTGEASDAS